MTNLMSINGDAGTAEFASYLTVHGRSCSEAVGDVLPLKNGSERFSAIVSYLYEQQESEREGGLCGDQG